MHIGNKRIGHGAGTYIIAEIAQAHDGSLGFAHAYIGAAATAGADAIKFQTHIAAAESTPDEPFRVQFSYEDDTRYDYWKRMEFSFEQWCGLARHAKEQGLDFLSSPFSLAAVDLLARVGVPAWKVGSGEVLNPLLLSALKATNLPILLSSGMSSMDDIQGLVKSFSNYEPGWALFQCTTMYPTPLESVGINVIDMYREQGVPLVGLSDHSASVHPAMAAIATGVDLLEVHVNFDKSMFGPDSTSSLTFDELALVVEHAKAVKVLRDNPVDKNAMAQNLHELKAMFGKGLILRRDAVAGQELTIDVLDAKKPCQGIPVSDLEKVIGRKLKSSMAKGAQINWDSIE